MPAAPVVIVGGGVSGLATAYFLGKLGLCSTIIEKSQRLGGLIRTDSFEGCQLEAGPDSFLAAKPAVAELAGELGDLHAEIIGSNDAERRIFVVRDQKLVAMPEGMVMVAPGKWGPALQSDLFSLRTKLRFVSETLRLPRHRPRDVSVAEFVEDHFGREVLEYVAEPLLSGVYGGNAARLSAQSVLPRFVDYESRYGSLIRAVRRERRGPAKTASLFQSFRGGMQTLTDALAAAIHGCSTVVQSEAVTVERTGGGWRVATADGSIECDHVILACPAHNVARLIEKTAPVLASHLGAIPYSSAILVTLVYERNQVPHPLNGFGFLVPRGERRVLSAATWVGTKFPCRVPANLAVLRGFIVDPQSSPLLKASKDQIEKLVREEFERLLGVQAAPRFSIVHMWPDSMPQYVLGHEQRRLVINGLLQVLAGLHLVGNAYEGVGIPDCIRLAKETANRIGKTLFEAAG
ncbi:MAG: protoporphyrinogen oxidase [Acidobacteriaceae bacterium]|nr:protoporphyrinogen oxidase [Acidobacteriaceae bacterium]